MLKTINYALLSSSLLILVSPSIYTYVLTLGVLMVKVFLDSKQYVRKLNMFLILIFLAAYILDIVISNHIVIDGLIKNTVLVLIILFGIGIPNSTIIKFCKIILYLNVFITIINFIYPIIPIGRVYENIYFLGKKVNSGLFFELNYSAMVTIISAFYVYGHQKIKLLMILAFTFFLFTFRVSLLIAPLVFLYQSRALIITFFISLVLLLIYIFSNYGVFLEQRFFIWTSFIENYEFKIERIESFQNKMTKIMNDSPWGYSGLNLHNGFFESLISRGLISTTILYFYIIVIFFRTKSSNELILASCLILTIFMSLSVGGLNFLSIMFTLEIFKNINNDIIRG